MKKHLFALLDILKITKIKIVSNPHFTSQNLFQEDTFPCIEFNGYFCFLEYGNKLLSNYENFKLACDEYLNHPEHRQVEKMMELNLMEHELDEFRFNYFPNGIDSILMERIDRSVLRNLATNEIDQFHSKVTYFFKQQFNTIHLISKYLKHRVKYVKKFFQSQIVAHCSKIESESSVPLDVNQRENLHLFPLNKHVTNLRWGKDKVQLLELLTAIYESDSIRSTTGEKLTKKDFFNLMMWVFNVQIKNVSSLLNSVKNRKSQSESYLTELQIVFHNYCE